MKWPRSLTRRFWKHGALSPGQFEARRDALIKKMPPPTFWLFGKTGSGKSSVCKLLTGATDVQIGNGFRPTTRHTDRYDFPDPDMPMMKFLDTRGLGEPGYVAEEDLAGLEDQAHAMIVTHRVSDFATEILINPLAKIRAAAPERPVLLALTCLHETYPQQPHPPYPFGQMLDPPGIPEALRRAVSEQRTVFSHLVDAVVPVDLTRPEHGFDPPDYGGEHLIDTLSNLLPAAYRFSLRNMDELWGDLKDLYERAAMPYVHGAASMAAAAGLTPIPWVDIPLMGAIQTRMVYAIARVYHQQASAQQLVELLAAAGIGFAARMGVRELVKLIPYAGTIAGGVLGAALGYSYTYALGKVCCWYHSSVLSGHAPSQSEISAVFRTQWQEGRRVWKVLRSREGPP